MIPVFPGRYDRVSGYSLGRGTRDLDTVQQPRRIGNAGGAVQRTGWCRTLRHMDSRDRSPRQMKRPGRTPVWLYVVLAVVAVVAVVLVVVALATR